ncbi:serine/threonine-protein kinase [Nocardioides sp.]|uniref:serine/threonine-protein kinase n=1 Tax=Nocardioides sp. TaxID=35761 RepID=UPI002B279672|nr:serine/threonine-protein kinase [Nocardioides sp.]
MNQQLSDPGLPPEADAVVGPTTVLAQRYVLGAVLGRGGAADVYRAEDRLLDRQVAVKVLRSGTDSATDRARFIGEARTLANLGHHGLVTVLDAGISEAQLEQPFLVMELVDGHTLSETIAGGPSDLADITRVAIQLADAIAYAHQRDVVHRDVKPGNVLLDASGTVKLADFGISRLIGDAARHTQTGHAVGTAAYLAPEQVQGEPLTTAVDLYSLGLVLLEMFTSRREYPGPPAEAALARLSRQPVIPDDIPPHWRALLADLTAREPSARPSATWLASRLRELPLVPPPPGPPPGLDQPAPTAVLTNVVPQQQPQRQPGQQPVPTVPAAAAQLSALGERLGHQVRGLERDHVVLALVALAMVLLLIVAGLAA